MVYKLHSFPFLLLFVLLLAGAVRLWVFLLAYWQEASKKWWVFVRVRFSIRTAEFLCARYTGCTAMYLESRCFDYRGDAKIEKGESLPFRLLPLTSKGREKMPSLRSICLEDDFWALRIVRLHITRKLRITSTNCYRAKKSFFFWYPITSRYLNNMKRYTLPRKLCTWHNICVINRENDNMWTCITDLCVRATQPLQIDIKP